MTYSKRELALDEVKRSLLASSGASPDLVEAVLAEDDFIDGYGGAGWGTTGRGPGASDSVFMGQRTFHRATSEKYYAIRNDDLKFGEECLSVAVEIATWLPLAGIVAGIATILVSGGAVAALAAAPTTVTVAAAKGLVTLGMRLRKKCANLSDDEFAVLAALKHHGPHSMTDLVLILNGMRLSPPFRWTEQNTTQRLEELKAKRLHDGTTRALVEKSGDGLWGACDV